MTGRKEYKMKKTITLADFCGRYINSATGEVLFPDEIEDGTSKDLS